MTEILIRILKRLATEQSAIEALVKLNPNPDQILVNKLMLFDKDTSHYTIEDFKEFESLRNRVSNLWVKYSQKENDDQPNLPEAKQPQQAIPYYVDEVHRILTRSLNKLGIPEPKIKEMIRAIPPDRYSELHQELISAERDMANDNQKINLKNKSTLEKWRNIFYEIWFKYVHQNRQPPPTTEATSSIIDFTQPSISPLDKTNLIELSERELFTYSRSPRLSFEDYKSNLISTRISRTTEIDKKDMSLEKAFVTFFDTFPKPLTTIRSMMHLLVLITKARTLLSSTFSWKIFEMAFDGLSVQMKTKFNQLDKSQAPLNRLENFIKSEMTITVDDYYQTTAEERDQSLNCRYCHRNGHEKKDCAERMTRLFCRQCYEFGHFKDCTNDKKIITLDDLFVLDPLVQN